MCYWHSISCQLFTTFHTLERNLGAEGCRSLILAAKDSWTTGCPVQPFWSYNYIHCLSARHFCGPGDWPVIDQAYQLSTARTNAYTNCQPFHRNCSVTSLRNNPAIWDWPGLQSKVCHVCIADFERKAGTVREFKMRSDKTRTRLLFAGLRSCNFLVKESFPLLKTTANVYQSLQEAFYQCAKVPHFVYSSVNVYELSVHVSGILLVDNRYWSIISSRLR